MRLSKARAIFENHSEEPAILEPAILEKPVVAIAIFAWPRKRHIEIRSLLRVRGFVGAPRERVSIDLIILSADSPRSS